MPSNRKMRKVESQTLPHPHQPQEFLYICDVPLPARPGFERFIKNVLSDLGCTYVSVTIDPEECKNTELNRKDWTTAKVLFPSPREAEKCLAVFFSTRLPEATSSTPYKEHRIPPQSAKHLALARFVHPDGPPTTVVPKAGKVWEALRPFGSISRLDVCQMAPDDQTEEREVYWSVRVVFYHESEAQNCEENCKRIMSYDCNVTKPHEYQASAFPSTLPGPVTPLLAPSATPDT